MWCLGSVHVDWSGRNLQQGCGERGQLDMHEDSPEKESAAIGAQICTNYCCVAFKHVPSFWARPPITRVGVWAIHRAPHTTLSTSSPPAVDDGCFCFGSVGKSC